MKTRFTSAVLALALALTLSLQAAQVRQYPRTGKQPKLEMTRS